MSGADESADEVVVQLSGPAKEDAHGVFCVLSAVCSGDRGPEDLPQETAGKRPLVWTGTFHTTGARTGAAGPVRLTAPVTATLQGGYRAVDSLRQILASSFTVRVVGTAAGDQEKEVQLRLESR